MASAEIQKVLSLASRRFRLKSSDLALDDDIFERLGIDSLQALDFMSELECEFGVTIPDGKLKEIRTFRHLADIVSKH